MCYFLIECTLCDHQNAISNSWEYYTLKRKERSVELAVSQVTSANLKRILRPFSKLVFSNDYVTLENCHENTIVTY